MALKKGEKYVVKAGDTYAEIAKKYKVPVFLLLQANSGFTKRLTIGDSLAIPAYVRPPRKMSKANEDEIPVELAKSVEQDSKSQASRLRSRPKSLLNLHRNPRRRNRSIRLLSILSKLVTISLPSRRSIPRLLLPSAK